MYYKSNPLGTVVQLPFNMLVTQHHKFGKRNPNSTMAKFLRETSKEHNISQHLVSCFSADRRLRSSRVHFYEGGPFFRLAQVVCRECPLVAKKSGLADSQHRRHHRHPRPEAPASTGWGAARSWSFWEPSPTSSTTSSDTGEIFFFNCLCPV